MDSKKKVYGLLKMMLLKLFKLALNQAKDRLVNALKKVQEDLEDGLWPRKILTMVLQKVEDNNEEG